MNTLPDFRTDLRKAICRRPWHCWLTLHRHTWFEYILAFVDKDGKVVDKGPELHRMCLRCRLGQVWVGWCWLKCPSCTQ